MFFSSARSGRTRSVRFSGLSLTVALAFASINASADWTDPLETPAIKTDRAHETLLLDITTVDSRLVAVGAHGNIIFSDNEGMNWSQASVPVSVPLTAIDFADEKNGWVVGHDGIILHSTDGGLNWQKQFDGYQANELIVANSEVQFKIAEEKLKEAEATGDSDRIYDAEVAFEVADFGLQDAQYDLETGSTKPFLDVWFETSQRGIAIGAYGMFFETLDGGNSWTDISNRLPNPDRMHLNSIVSVGPNAIAVIGESGFIARSNDNGASFTLNDAPYEGSLFGAVDRDDTQLLFSLRGHVYRSSDDGSNWTELMTGSEQTLFGGVIGDETALLVGNGGSVILFDKELENPRSIIIEGRSSSAAVAATEKGNFVVVGESGVKILDPRGQLVVSNISMTAETK